MTTSTGPPGKRRGGHHQEAAHNVADTTIDRPIVTDETLCDLCARRPKWRHYSLCAKCIRDLGDALNRRRDAELRMPPVDRGTS